MRFGLLFLPTFDTATHDSSAGLYQQIFQQVELAEQLGFHSVWAAEHHFTPYGGDIPNPCTLLAALAQRTTRMRLGTAGTALPLNHALNTAEQLAMVDALSNGRLDIGVVRAFLHFEYEALQIDMEASRERFNESLEILRKAFAEPVFSHQGKHYQFENVALRPRPIQTQPRIMVGTVLSPESARYAGLNGLDLMVIPYAVSLEGVKQTVALYHEALREAGHDPAKHQVHGCFHMYTEANEDACIAHVREPLLAYVQYFIDAISGDRWSNAYPGYQGMVDKVRQLKNFEVLYDRRSLIGTPARLRETIAMAADAGITELSFITVLPGLAQTKVLDSLRLFAAEVMPAWR